MKAWRESASLIFTAHHGRNYIRTSFPSNFQYNYSLMCLKRHQNSKFMPSKFVFPGGVIHPSDSDLKWNSLFSTFGIQNSSFKSLNTTAHNRPSIFNSQPNQLPKEISLRITAIRETFEECGVLICRRSAENFSRNNWAHCMEVPKAELHNWQKKVHNDATEFFNLCEDLKCYPDLWSLHEWSNWLTPTCFPERRYDTMFFLVCMPFIPYANYEPTEMEELKWDVPGNLLFPSTVFSLSITQRYEVSRIAKFENINNLLDFAVDRVPMGTPLLLPVRIQLKDGRAYVLPGDSMYPKNLSLVEKQIIDKSNLTMEELRDMSAAKNRVEVLNMEIQDILVENLDNLDGHLPPIQSKDIATTTINKNIV